MNPAALLARLASAPAFAGDNWFFLPEQASTFAARVDDIFNFINLVNLAFFVCMMGATIYFVIAYRQRGGVHHKTSPNKGHHQLELAWSLGPSLLLLVFFYTGFKTWMDTKVAPADAMEIRVTGQKWSWGFDYTVERDGKSRSFFTSEALVVPIHTPVLLTMTSTDVLHSFFVPAFRVKQDVVPNRYSTIWFEAIMKGDFDIFCTEYCGTDHSRMHSIARVVSEEDYESWVDAQLASGPAPDSEPWERGQANFAGKFACTACHSTEGATLVGPHLDGKYGTEETLADGSTVTVDDNYIRESVMTPAAKIVSGFTPAMPPFAGRVTDAEMIELIEFIKHIGAE